MIWSPKKAPLIALTSALLFGLSTPLAKMLMGDLSPWLLAALLYLGSGLGLTLVILFRPRQNASEATLRRNDLPWLAGTVFFGGVVGPILLLLGLSTTDAASASLLLNLEAVFTLLLAWVIFREHVDRKLFAGAVAILAGALLLSWQGGLGKASFGMVLISLACLSWAIDNNLTRRISAVDPFILAAVKGVVAGTVNAALAFAMGASLPSLPVFASAMLLGFVSYGLGLVLFIIALRYLGAARTGAYYGTAPFIGALAASVIFGTPITSTLVIAGGLMALGAWLHLSERHVHYHDHEILDHDHKHTHDEHHQHDHGPNQSTTEPHSHPHHHGALVHGHAHWPDLHHRHGHHTH
jgi:drug/metabolite transporter (DMT)-like permease